MKLKSLAILLLVLVSLLPVYILYRYLNRIIRPRESLQRFFLWLLAVLALVFACTFSVVLLIKLLFPGA